MRIELNNCGRRYNAHWIFRSLSKSFDSGSRTAILGSNGSGKSTLLKVLAGALLPSEGKISWFGAEGEIQKDKVYQSVSLATPYLDVPPMLTPPELIDLHHRFRSFMVPVSEILQIAELDHAAGKKIGTFSSGMKQRLRLSLAILCDSKFLLIDEPHTNLDRDGMKWYSNMLSAYSGTRSVFICSNHQAAEYESCHDHIDLSDYKVRRSEAGPPVN